MFNHNAYNLLLFCKEIEKERVKEWNGYDKSKASNLFIFQNFGVCSKCSRLAQLYHKLHHQKQSMFNVCSDVVETRKKNSAGLDTTRMLNELLADDSWLETVSETIQFLICIQCCNFVVFL